MELEQNSTSSNLLLWLYPTDLIIEEETCILSIVLFFGNGIAKFIIIYGRIALFQETYQKII